MITNKEVTGVNNQKNFRPPLNYGSCVSNEKQFVRCVCPKCSLHHDVYMLWTGRGLPRIFCGQCKSAVAGYDDMVISEPSIFSAGYAKKRGKSAACE